MDKMNILILSVGTRNKVVQYFKRNFEGYGNVVVTDMSLVAPAIYDADKFYQVPCMTSNGYIDVIFDICKKENISAIMSLIDPELSLLAKHAKEFEDIGVKVIGSTYELCERCLDKWEMYKWLKSHGYKCARSYMDKNEFYRDLNEGLITFPVFVKPARGSASISISKVHDKETINNLFDHEEGLMIQEFMDGVEIGVDCYIDLVSKELVSVFCKEKIVMRAGETDKAVSIKDDTLFKLVERFISDSGFVGQIDIDVFKVDGEYYISEVNPRFGGGYPHAYECGANHMKMIRSNLQGIANEKHIGEYEEGVYMMKYNEVKIKKI